MNPDRLHVWLRQHRKGLPLADMGRGSWAVEMAQQASVDLGFRVTKDMIYRFSRDLRKKKRVDSGYLSHRQKVEMRKHSKSA